jgi:para-nitrobenzyl esterase
MRTLTLALLLIAFTAQAQITPPHVHIPQGDLEGAPTGLGPFAFKGIPYAAPPVGDLRWQPPQPAPSWTGTRDAAQYSKACYQDPALSHRSPESMSEDCLYLNVWTSDLHPAQPAPVLVYIHGGAFVTGSGSSPDIDGTKLAMRNAVVVTLNYRLGVFGFFAHPDLSAASPQHTSGNYGILDQIAALRWVRQNISAFGGDPHNLTVFGESAGASSIGYLLITPQSEGLFDKAILESPSVIFQPTPELRTTYKGLTSMETIGLAVAPHIADLKSLSSDALLQQAEAATQKLLLPTGTEPNRTRLRPETLLDTPTQIQPPWAPIVDGTIIPDQPSRLYSDNRYHRIPVMVGTNTNEGNLFLRHYQPTDLSSFNAWVHRDYAPCAQTILEAYAPKSAAEAHSAADRLITDSNFLYNAFSIARTTHAFLYRFTHVSPTGEASGMGAFHSSELPYVFGHTHEKNFQPYDHKLSDQMMTMWLHFARTGDPRLMESSEWTRTGSNGEYLYMDFGDKLEVKDLPDTTMKIWANLWPPSGKAASCGK